MESQAGSREGPSRWPGEGKLPSAGAKQVGVGRKTPLAWRNGRGAWAKERRGELPGRRKRRGGGPLRLALQPNQPLGSGKEALQPTTPLPNLGRFPDRPLPSLLLPLTGRAAISRARPRRRPRLTRQAEHQALHRKPEGCSRPGGGGCPDLSLGFRSELMPFLGVPPSPTGAREAGRGRGACPPPPAPDSLGWASGRG